MIALGRSWRALACAAVILAGLALADRAEAGSLVIQGEQRTAGAICYTYNPTVTKKNRLGNVLYRMQINLRWCSNGRRVTSPSASAPWFPKVSAWCCDVAGVSSPVSRWENYNGHWRGAYYVVRQAHVKSCIPLRAACKHYYPYIKARMLYTGKAVLWRYAG